MNRMFGGAMRQVGMLAAACDYGLTHNLAHLADDHAHARMIAGRLVACPGVRMNLDQLHTNIVVRQLDGTKMNAT